MSKIDLYSPQWVDMVFEGRNQNYGAYKLRKSIGKRNFWAIVIMLVAAFIIGSAIGINTIIENQKAHEAYLAEMRASKLAEEQAKKDAAKKKKEQPKIEPKVEPKEQIPEVRKTVQFTAPVIKPDNQVKKEINLQDIEKELDKGAAAGATTTEGSTNRNVGAVQLNQTTEPIKIEEPKKEEPKVEQKVENKILTIAEQMPSFKGNVNAWLSSHLSYPAVAAENGIQGKVIVKFVVGKDGSVSQAQVVRGVDPSLDKEAIRAVNSMPKWNPGMNNGQPASVWFTLPVTFKLQ